MLQKSGAGGVADNDKELKDSVIIVTRAAVSF